MYKKLLFLLLVLVLCPRVSEAQVVLGDCYPATILAAYNSAVGHANLQCPAGTFIWDASRLADANFPTNLLDLHLEKDLTLTGAGDGCADYPTICLTGTGNPLTDTIIIDDFNRTGLKITTFPNNKYNISGIRWDPTNIPRLTEDAIRITGTTSNFKWHDWTWDGCGITGANFRVSFKVINAAITGVLYNTYTLAGGGSGNSRMDLYADVWGGGTNLYGDGSWAEDAQWGTDKFLFLENNTFQSCPGTSSLSQPENQGGFRGVFRFNQWIDANGGGMLHGTETGGRERSPRGMEVYHNTYQDLTGACLVGGEFRGGSMLWFNNTMSCYTGIPGPEQHRSIGNFGVWRASDGSLKFDLNDGVVYAQGVASAGSGSATLVVTGAGWTTNQWRGYSARDCGPGPLTQALVDSCHAGNVGTGSYVFSNTTDTITVATNSTTAAPNWASGTDVYLILRATKVMDAIGRGRGKLLDPVNPPTCSNCVNSGPYSERGLQQVTEPSYQFNNLRCNANTTPRCTPSVPDTTSWPGTLADYSNIGAGGRGPHVIANRDIFQHVALASFTGATGVSLGPIGSRPATCTTAGVGYWATDEGFWRTDTPGVAAGRLYQCFYVNAPADVAEIANDRGDGSGATEWRLYYTPFTYPHPLRSVAGPTLVSLSPTSGTRTLASVPVTLTGTGFNGGSFGITIDSACTGVSAGAPAGATDTARTSTFTLTAAAEGVCGVTVHTTAGTSTAQTFTVSAPIITGIAPPAANQGETTSVTITGTTLNGATPVLSFSGTSITYNSFSCSSSTTCTANFVVAADAQPGVRTLTYSTFDGTDNDIFQVFDVVIITKPVLDSITPASCYRGEKCPTLFRGTAFTGATLIKSCSDSVMTVANTVVVSDFLITADITVPANAFNETCDFQVTTGGAPAFVGAEMATAPGTSVTIPAHLEGDLILMFPYRNSQTMCTVPDGWTEAVDPISQTNYSSGVYWQIAADASTVSGTWTSCIVLGTMVLRGVASNAIGNVTSANVNGTTVLYPDNTFNVADGTSIAVGFGCTRNNDATFAATAPTGMTNRDSASGTNGSCGIHTSAAVVGWGAQSVAVTSGRNGAFVVEIGGAGGSNIRSINPLQPAGGSAGELRAK